MSFRGWRLHFLLHLLLRKYPKVRPNIILFKEQGATPHSFPPETDPRYLGFLLQKVPLPYALGVNVVLWGVTVACTAACSSFGSLLAVRIILGSLEAVISPALVLITTTWYQRGEASPRYGIWYCGLGGGQILGGILSFAFQHVTTKNFEGWRMMFVVVGAVNIVVGGLVVFYLPAKPQDAKFLSSEEKSFVLARLAVNQTGLPSKNAKRKQIIEAFMDTNVWLLCLITVLCSLSSGVITTFSATLIKNFGYTSKVSKFPEQGFPFFAQFASY